MRKNYHL
ncbi:hypothetical protein D047_5039A, partial [Vibrio parahaemolyticus VPTS-2010_2]